MKSGLVPIIVAVVLAIVAAGVAIFVSNAQTAAKFNTVDTNLDSNKLWTIQPGLGTVMIEYGIRFDNMWYAGDAGNWDMVTYQLKEMREIQETGEVTRPGRADALKKFENDNLTLLDAAAKAQDKNAFADAYDKTITGCNTCHAQQKDSATGKNFAFVKIQRPSAPAFNNVDWKGQ